MAKSINHLATADALFFGKGGLDQRKTAKMVDDALAGCDDGELFLEYEQSEGLSFDDGKLKSASYDTTQGFGLRSVAGEATGFAHASALDEAALKRAVATVKAVRAGKSGKIDKSPRGTNQLLYADDNPIDGEAFARKVALAAGDRRLCARQGAQGAPGLDLDGGLVAGRRDHPRRRLACRRRAPAGAAERERGLCRRQLAWNRAAPAAASAPPTATSSSRSTGSAKPTRRSARRWSTCSRSPRPPARCRSCWGRAGRACCGTRPWATGWKAISIARRRRSSPG